MGCCPLLHALIACFILRKGLAQAPVEAQACHADSGTALHELGLDALEEALGSRPVAWHETRLAEIWNGYGSITRLELTLAGEASPNATVIAKQFVPASARQTNRSEHERFLGSILVEIATYAELWGKLAEVGLRAPRPLLIPVAQLGAPATLLLEDLSAQFPRGAEGVLRQMTQDEVRAAVQWLAGFHALYWEVPRAAERGLWSRGTYWHLDTWGREELASVPEAFSNRYIDNREWRRLRGAAESIDARLAGRSASGGAPDTRFRTLLHGDAKPANVMCSAAHGPPAVECALLDFSWVGEGYGMCDVMYLLWGEFTQADIDGFLGDYHAALMGRLAGRADYSKQVMRRHFELCVLDLVRWWAGFRAGEHFWAMPWALDTLREVLDRLDGGRPLTAAEYAEAIDREFPFP